MHEGGSSCQSRSQRFSHRAITKTLVSRVSLQSSEGHPRHEIESPREKVSANQKAAHEVQVLVRMFA